MHSCPHRALMYMYYVICVSHGVSCTRAGEGWSRTSQVFDHSHGVECTVSHTYEEMVQVSILMDTWWACDQIMISIWLAHGGHVWPLLHTLSVSRRTLWADLEQFFSWLNTSVLFPLYNFRVIFTLLCCCSSELPGRRKVSLFQVGKEEHIFSTLGWWESCDLAGL